MGQPWFAAFAVVAVLHVQCGFAGDPVVLPAGQQVEQVDFGRAR